MSLSVYDLFTNGLFLIFLAWSAYLRVDSDLS
jgi:hypothetical protein